LHAHQPGAAQPVLDWLFLDESGARWRVARDRAECTGARGAGACEERILRAETRGVAAFTLGAALGSGAGSCASAVRLGLRSARAPHVRSDRSPSSPAHGLPGGSAFGKILPP